MASIVQWNCQGYAAKYEDLKGLLYNVHPKVAVLQETMLGGRTPRSPTGYKLHTDNNGNHLPGNGLAFLIRNDVPSQPISLRTRHQAIAFRIQLDQIYSICNIYISHHEDITIESISSIVGQLPEPILICGDFNSKHTMWGNNIIDRKGQILQTFILNNNLYLINTGQKNHFH